MEFLEVFLYNVNILRTKEKVIQREDLYNEEKKCLQHLWQRA